MKKIECVIMDWAGTAVDYGCFAPVAAFLKAFAEKGLTVTMEEARGPMGMTKIDHIRELFKLPSVTEQFKQNYNRNWTEEDVVSIYKEFEKHLFASLEEYTTPIPGVIEVIEKLKRDGIKIGSTTGYTTAMMDIVLPGAAAHGYTTDNCVTSNNLPAGRPQPYMIYQNMIDLAIPSVQSVIKYGDTIADIKEGVNAGVWTVGVILGSNEMGLTQEETGKLPAEELNRRMAAVRKRMYMAGAHYVVNTIAELPEIIEIINHKDLDLYKGFYDWLGKPEMFKQGKNRKLEYADVAPLLYLKLALEDNKTMYGIKHLLVDEMQDYTPIQYKVLAKLFPCRKTILGDAKQSVNPYSSTTCEQIQRVLVGSEVMKLCKSYRSTYEITEFAQRIAKNEELEAIERHGEEPAVALLPTEKKEIEWIENLITSFLKGADVSMGIICKTVKQADKLYAAINHLSDKICLLTEESVAFVNGVVITTAHMAKGLEFDEVIVPFVTDKDYRTEIDRSMLYVACTRAMHKLYISASGNISTFLS
jgi:phosphonoacetaldehyde hydrolase